ncbi:MAG: PIG-L family deacetylase [Candidatus Acidiferrales bacterium]
MPKKIATLCIAAAAICLLAAAPLRAQSLPETVEAIDKARVTTRILFITAHPDDEASGLLSYLSHGLDADVGLFTITRGQGGQNAIGPEQGERLGMLRTSELLAASQHNGVTQFFSRAPDFGYSKSAAQTMKIWGDTPLEDMVRVIRTFRPNIVINGWGGIQTGHGQHQSSGILTPQAVKQAADPNVFPDQLKEGLKPWSVALLLDDRRAESKTGFRVPTEQVSALWGKSYSDFGRESLVYHRSQGVTMFLSSPFLRASLYLVIENPDSETQTLSPVDLAKTLKMLAMAATPMGVGLEKADDSLAAAHDAALQLDWAAAIKSLAAAGSQIAALRKTVTQSQDSGAGDLAWELDHEREKIDRALAGAAALHIDARADKNELVAGESFKVDARWTLRTNAGITVNDAAVIAPRGWAVAGNSAPASGDRRQEATDTISVPSNAAVPSSPADAVLPWPPPLVRERLELTAGNYSFAVDEPVVSIHATSTSVDTFPLTLVPAVTLTIEPKQVMAAESREGAPIELLARVRYHATAAAKVDLGVKAPEGWSVAPVNAVDFSASGDQLVRFQVTPPPKLAAGTYSLRPFSSIGNNEFDVSVEPLPSLPTRNWTEPTLATVHVVDLTVPKDLRVGYITVETDPLPEMLGQLGIRVERINEIELAFGDLSHFDSIVVGIRAYELRPDLPRANSRLLDYMKQGGTLLVQYQRDFAWNRILPAPFPATMPESTARTTDANSPVHFLAPDSPLLNFPNKITLEDFKGWTQERGLYYWGKFDPHYQPILGLTDPGEEELNGALVTARVEKGVYIYTGLSFFRELPAGVPGAYRLFVNLLSRSKAPSQ